MSSPFYHNSFTSKDCDQYDSSSSSSMSSSRMSYDKFGGNNDNYENKINGKYDKFYDYGNIKKSSEFFNK